ncbi:MAG: type II secretion system secretin GspD [Polyangiaceae bacterium]|nr:type II secretion system secretin GspD [Polyangiaceae bacterium]
MKFRFENSWLAAGAWFLAANLSYAQVPPKPSKPGAAERPAAALDPNVPPSDQLPGAGTTLPTTMEAIQKAVEAPYRPKPAGFQVKFNLQDADLAELVNHISGMTGKRFIYGPKVRQIKATVVSPEPVSLAEAYEAFLSILEQNGMTVVPHGQFLKIVDSGGVVTRTTPLYSPGSLVPDTDRYITRLYRLKNTTAEEVAALLTKFKSAEGDISIYPPGQLLIITDTGAQIQRQIRIIEEIDVGSVGSKMWIEPVHYGTAKELSERINELFDLGKAGAGATGGLAKVVADEQSNSLIVVGTEDSYLKLLELMKRLDTEPTAEGKLHVLPLQHAVADELSNTLNQMLQGAKGKDGQAAGMFEGEVRVTPDKATNSLVVTSSGRDYAHLRLVVEELDMPRRQVFIEAVIMDVSVNHSTALGLKYHAGTTAELAGDGNSLVYGGLNPIGSILPPDPTALQGLALGIRGPELTGADELLGIGFSVPAFGVVLNALSQSGDANVLATPHILATDNVAAEINVGENIPLQENIGGGIGNLASLASGSGNTNLAGLSSLMGGGYGFSSPRQDVGTKIKVTPHINDSNQVRLEIEEEISERGASSGALGAVSITQRNANTTLVVDDQQTVVIGGLMRDAVVKSKEKIPILGDIPVLGFLFRSSTTETQKTNLLLILTPYVIHDQSDLRRIFERKMQERQEFLDRYFVFARDAWEPPKNYTRTNGLVEEIRQTYFEIEERERLEAESQPLAKEEHIPSEPIELPVTTVPTGGAKGSSSRGAKPAATPASPPATPPKPATTPSRRRSRPTGTTRTQGQLAAPFQGQKMARSVEAERME